MAACSTSGGMMTDVQRRRVDKEAAAARARGSSGGAGGVDSLNAAGLAQGLSELISGSFRAASSFQFDNLGVSPFDAEQLSSAIAAVEAMRTIDLALRGTTVELTPPPQLAPVQPAAPPPQQQQQQQQQYNQYQQQGSGNLRGNGAPYSTAIASNGVGTAAMMNPPFGGAALGAQLQHPFGAVQQPQQPQHQSLTGFGPSTGLMAPPPPGQQWPQLGSLSGFGRPGG